MNLYLVNESADANVTPIALAQIVDALETQLAEHWAPAWERLPPTIAIVKSETDVPPLGTLVVIHDTPDVAGALGYHTLTPEGRIYSPVFWGVIRDNGGTLMSGSLCLSATLSHEGLELATNPYVALYADRDDGTEEPVEVCDRVEGDSYNVGGVSVSNFLTPRAFADSLAGPWDYMGKLTSRDGMTPGGYYAPRSGGPNGTTTQIFGERMPEWRRAQLRTPHPATRAARKVSSGAMREVARR